MNAADIISIIKELGPLVIALATLLTAISTFRQGKENQAAIAANTQITQDNKVSADVQLKTIHTLVNDMSTRGLGREAGQADRIAGLTGDPGDQRAAIQARAEYDTKKATDASVLKKEV